MRTGVAKALRDDLHAMQMAQSELTDEERMTLGLFLESYDDEWGAYAFMAGMTMEENKKRALGNIAKIKEQFGLKRV